MFTQNNSSEDGSSIKFALLLPLSLFLLFGSGEDEYVWKEESKKQTAIISSFEDNAEVKSNVSVTDFYNKNSVIATSSPTYHKPQVLGTKEIQNKEKEVKVPEVKKTFIVEVTGYSSTPDQTNCQPFITASGERVRDGIVAANFLEFGTKIRIPEYFGEKVFVVKDRMNTRYTFPKNDSYDGYVDIWFETRYEARQMGRTKIEIEIIE